ncbi:caspase family protein [Candidatus Gracilibacteria bacterium]|nr:caspase family protein [Candidatus Gracilibacteria bacterium]
MPEFKQGHALVIGVGSYNDSQWNVPIALRDAEVTAATLRDPAFAAYPPGQVRLLCDAEATRQGLLQALTTLGEGSGPADTALIMFTGHGAMSDDGLYYLASSDTQFTAERNVVSKTGVSIADLKQVVAKLPAGRVLLVINACFSGNVTGSVIPDRFSTEIVRSSEGRAIITASKSDQLSHFDTTREHSFFGQALIDGLRGVGSNAASGYVGLYELYQQIYTAVTRNAQQRRQQQEPALTVLQAVGPFPIALYPGGAPGPQSAPIAQMPPAPATVIDRSVTVSVTQQHGGVSFEGASIGNLSVGQITGGDSFNSTVNYNPAADKAADPPTVSATIDKVIARLQSFNNIDPDQRDDAVNKLRQARRASESGDNTRARERLAEAREIMEAMQHTTVSSLANKISTAIVMLKA